MAITLSACDNNTFSDSSIYSLFETSEGVVYLINESTGDLETVSPKKTTTLHKGEAFMDNEGKVFKYLGDGKVKPAGQADSLADKHSAQQVK
ncbi:MAG: hypothetical protein ACQES2_08160 [Pseudomonadota bacterium]